MMIIKEQMETTDDTRELHSLPELPKFYLPFGSATLFGCAPQPQPHNHRTRHPWLPLRLIRLRLRGQRAMNVDLHSLDKILFLLRTITRNMAK